VLLDNKGESVLILIVNQLGAKIKNSVVTYIHIKYNAAIHTRVQNCVFLQFLCFRKTFNAKVGVTDFISKLFFYCFHIINSF